MPVTGVALVVVTHESCDELLTCLGSIEEDLPVEVVVVDSGSRDGCLGRVRESFPAVDLLAVANLGYGQAANAGVARTTSPYVVVANADTRFTPGVLGKLGDVLDQDPNVALVGPRVVYPDGRIQASARRFPSVPTAIGHALLGLWWPNNPWTRAYRLQHDGVVPGDEVEWLSGCAVAVRRVAFDRAGGFDPAYFMYVEDVDLAWRLRQLGWSVRYEGSAEVVHTVGSSTRHYRGSLAFDHARGLHRFWTRAYGRGPAGLLSPLVAAGLAIWATMAWLWQRWVAPRRGRSTTGE